MFSLIALKCKVRILPMRRSAAPLTAAVQPACGPNENIHGRKPRLASRLNKLQKHCVARLLSWESSLLAFPLVGCHRRHATAAWWRRRRRPSGRRAELEVLLSREKCEEYFPAKWQNKRQVRGRGADENWQEIIFKHRSSSEKVLVTS